VVMIAVDMSVFVLGSWTVLDCQEKSTFVAA
jgi:hypothetical protein